MEVWYFLQAAEEVARAGVFLEFCAPGSKSVSPFHLFHLFIDWSALVGFACLLVGVVGLVVLFCFFIVALLTNPIELSTNDHFSAAT